MPGISQLSRFLSVRGGSNSWAQSPSTIEAWRRGRVGDVFPLTLEFAPVLDCNADCPLCPYRRARTAVGSKRIPLNTLPRANDETVASAATVKRVLDASAEVGVRGVLWTGGGEPTLLEGLAEWCRYAARRGIGSGVYTNGIRLAADAALAGELLDPGTGTVFVRVSMNAITERVVRKHWGVRDAHDILAQFAGLENLLIARERRFETPGTRIPSIQVSTIIDHDNVGDLLPLCRAIAGLFADHPKMRSDDDALVVRPVIDHRRAVYTFDDRVESVVREILRVCGTGGPGREAIEGAGVPLRLGFGLESVESGAAGSYAEVVHEAYREREYDGFVQALFLTVGPDGSVYPCTELNCNPKWILGNLTHQSVTDIYRGDPRAAFLRKARELHFGPELFQPFGRSVRLGRIARAIRLGELTDGEIETIRKTSLASHSVLLN